MVHACDRAWKSKVRRLLFSGGSKGRKPTGASAHKQQRNVPLDTNNLNDLILEGMSVPVLSRVSSYLSKMLDDATKDTGGVKTNKKQRVSGGNASSVAYPAALAAGGASVAAIGGGEGGRVIVPLPGYPDSDDEAAEDSSSVSSSPFHYRVVPDFQMASVPDVWPSKSLGVLRPLVGVGKTLLASNYASANTTAAATARHSGSASREEGGGGILAAPASLVQQQQVETHVV
jgi:hypothetical protein